MSELATCATCGNTLPPDAPGGQCPICLLELGLRDELAEPKKPAGRVESKIGPHDVVRVIGYGGMGVVYEAWDSRLKRRVALKVLQPHLMFDAANRDRFMQEARLAANLDHEGVVRIFNIHEYDGMVVIEMQYVDGTPLNRLIADKPLSAVQAKDLLRQVLEGLAACHERGVVHCDVKPANLLITAEGKVLLTDFGISRAFQATSADLSMSTQAWGTPAFWPPEAWEGELPAPAWDIYALGILAFQALTGALPFEATTLASLMREKLDMTVDSLYEKMPEVDPVLAKLIGALASKDRTKRPATASAALEMVKQAEDNTADWSNTHSLKHDPTKFVTDTSASTLPFIRLGSQSEENKERTAFGSKAAAVSSIAAALAVLIFVFAPNRPPEESDEGRLGFSPVAEIAPLGAEGEILELYAASGDGFFSYDDGWRGRELWRVDKNAQAYMVADINPGPGSSNPRHFLLGSSGGFVFTAQTPEYGEELWYCGSRTTYPVKLIKDIIPGSMSSVPLPVASVENVYLFYASTLQHGRELWVTNSQALQTGILKDIDAGPGDSVTIPPHVFADESGVYFAALSGQGGWDLWRYSYSDSSARVVENVGRRMGEMMVLGDTLFFVKGSEETGFELWRYDPSAESIALVLDVYEGPDSSDPSQLFVWQDTLYFQAYMPNTGRELWKSDGTPEGTELVLDIASGKENGAPYGFIEAGDRLYFRAFQNPHGDEIWVTDGTKEGTKLYYDALPGGVSSHPYNLFTIGGQLFFSADDGVHGEELWGGNPVRLIRDIWPGSESAEPHGFVNLDEESGVFIYWQPDGQALMHVKMEDGELTLTPVTGLPRTAG